MNISIKEHSELPKEAKMELYLEDDDGVVYLRAQDGNDEPWTIVEFNDKGMKLWEGINESSGWPLTRSGALEYFLRSSA